MFKLAMWSEDCLAKATCNGNAGKVAAVRLRAETVMPVKWIAGRFRMGAPGYKQSPVIPAARGGMALSKNDPFLPFGGRGSARAQFWMLVARAPHEYEVLNPWRSKIPGAASD